MVRQAPANRKNSVQVRAVPPFYFRKEVLMKVHILWYDYYEDSDIVGIYTEEGKRKKIEELQQEALRYCKTYGLECEKELAKKKEKREILLKEVNQVIEDCKNAPENKSLKKLKKSLIKKDESLLKDIHCLKKEVENYFLPEKALEIYMKHNFLIWLKKEVIE